VGEHNITNESLALSMVLVLVAMVVSYREKLGLEKDILWSICRAVIQLIIVGYVLKYIFNVNHAVLTLLMVLFICFNAAWNAQKRSKYIDKAFVSSFIAITTGTALTLAVLVFSGSITFTPMQVIPISGMIAGNAMVAVGLCYNNLGQRFSSEQQQLQEKLSLGATPKVASAQLIRDSIRSSLIPTVDSAKTVGLVSLPGMMSGLIFAGIDPVKAIKYQSALTICAWRCGFSNTRSAWPKTSPPAFSNIPVNTSITSLRRLPVRSSLTSKRASTPSVPQAIWRGRHIRKVLSGACSMISLAAIP
jgi:putative ABC transport system permease protein